MVVDLQKLQRRSVVGVFSGGRRRRDRQREEINMGEYGRVWLQLWFWKVFKVDVWLKRSLAKGGS